MKRLIIDKENPNGILIDMTDGETEHIAKHHDEYTNETIWIELAKAYKEGVNSIEQ